ncbi:hypothetical protein D9M70_453240 [compost metagenome]
MAAAVAADIAPPAMVPIPGKDFKIFTTTVRPTYVAPPTPIADATIVLRVPFESSKPKTEVIPAIMPI